MKIKIHAVPTRTPGQFYWSVKIDGNITHWPQPVGAYEYVKKYLKRYYKECAAYSMVTSLAVNLLSEDEFSLIKSLKKSKCKGISIRQYGYLKGIHERQIREW